MSEVKVNKISPRTACGTVTLGDSGDTFTIPSGATITNAGTASGFGATGETSWDTTVKTNGTFTATAGVGYFLNTTAGTITVNLAAGTAGDSVALADYAATWQTNNVTVAANGTEKIGGVDADVTLSTEGQSVTFVYIDGTQGWVNVLDSTSNVRGNEFVVATGGTPCAGATSGDYKVHTFTGPGTFCVSKVGACATNNVVSYMVAAGGGSGATYVSGSPSSGGGGGSGGFREYKNSCDPYTASPLNGNPGGTAITVSATPYAIVVGGGGAAAGPGNPVQGIKGNNSSFSTITSTGGGYGGNVTGGPNVGGPGGSGGGGGSGESATAGGTGDDPSTTPDQGFPGGAAGCGAPQFGSGGGGGATEAGVTGIPTSGGRGGAGATTCISASPVAYAGGGGGSGGCLPAAPGAGSPCGTGGASSCAPTAATDGTINRGGGGGGHGSVVCTVSGAGGSGIVYIRYKFQ
jgi:hypothetical protein